MYRSHPKSSFNGRIDEIPNVSVDNFERTGYKAYFLSHCHTDHTNGLFSMEFLNYLKNKRVFIYMSEHSAAIIRHESKHKELLEYVKPLKIGSETITIPGEEINGTDDQYITISLIPAGHCFGSVMFLFKTVDKNILYTGDFRVSVNSVSKYAKLHENGEIIKLDALYVDTTFQNFDHEDFPKRSESVEVVIRHIRRWLNANDTNEVALHTSAKYGYEFVFNDIYKKLAQKVYVADDLWELYSELPNSVPGVTNELTSRIHRCKNRNENYHHDDCFSSCKGSANKAEYLYVHFSAYKWKNYQIDDTMVEVKNNRIDVCFATHCSRSELEYFVNYLSPKKIVGFPCEYSIARAENFTPTKRGAPKSAEKFSHPVKVARKLDKSVVMQIFAD